MKFRCTILFLILFFGHNNSVYAQIPFFRNPEVIQYFELPELKIKEHTFQSKPDLIIENKTDYYALFEEKDYKKLPFKS